MICEHLSRCPFILCVDQLMPVTAISIKIMYCKNAKFGCAKYLEHELIAIDIERGNLRPGPVSAELEIFEKKYSESYRKLCVRRLRETTAPMHSHTNPQPSK